MTDKVKSGTAKAVARGGHPTSGGHFGRATPGRAIRQNNQSAMSRFNRTRWDHDDGSTGDNMSYQYQEYPKHVYPDPSNPKAFVEVNSEHEERLVLNGENIVREEEERERLLALAHVKGVQVDKRWGSNKLSYAIKKAGYDDTQNPFE